MKILYQDIVKDIDPKPEISELSEKLFQLGHEHEIDGNVFDMEFTPNRGDCLSLRGLKRDLNLFYKADINFDIYEKEINPLSIDFYNNAKNDCPYISFMKIEIDETPDHYKDELESYFSNLDTNKINFFTDVSNYISYETGQPTHCYDSKTINNYIKLDVLNKKSEFRSLLNQQIKLDVGSLVFLNQENEIINVAGIVGSESTKCKKNTKSVIVECAYFNPETILGKSIKYSIVSDAAHKFERNTDPSSHEYVLRRFLKVVENHANIVNVELLKCSEYLSKNKSIRCDSEKITKILGFKVSKDKYFEYLSKIGFDVDDSYVSVPPYRHDITSVNDVAEEIARAIGYNNISSMSFSITSSDNIEVDDEEIKLKNLLVDEGFHEVINDPFTSLSKKHSIKVDNPLDKNRTFLRTELKESLLENLLYNERRQKDSIKLFEIANVYFEKDSSRRLLGIIGSGRVDKNYVDFSKKMNDEYLSNILIDKLQNVEFNFKDIPRESIDSKSKNSITYVEIELKPSFFVNYDVSNTNRSKINYKYNNISEFPSSTRDLSFSVKNYSEFKSLEKYILNFQNSLLKEVFVFDYFYNEKNNEIKIGFRFIFQSLNSTITDKEVNEVMNVLIKQTTKFNSVSIPGLT